jgi:FkbM family methyltransferase
MLGTVQARVSKVVKKLRYAPKIQVEPDSHLLRLGSKYGGWTFEPSADLEGATIVSCGLGEDASFDVEFAAKYGAKVILVDPTPRAIRHFEEIEKRFGEPAKDTYKSGGKQPASAYDLSKVGRSQLILEPCALWTEVTKLKFFSPPNPEHVSHSIVNYQNEYRKDSPFIEVPTITLQSLVEKYGMASLPLIKLDIEGAEVKVIQDLLAKSIRPRQLIVEFDEMNFPSERSKENAEVMDQALRRGGYGCRFFDHKANFLYALAK